MKTTANWKDLDLTGKCGSCKHYTPKIIKEKLVARGNCSLRNNQYKQRTESCLKHEKQK